MLDEITKLSFNPETEGTAMFSTNLVARALVLAGLGRPPRWRCVRAGRRAAAARPPRPVARRASRRGQVRVFFFWSSCNRVIWNLATTLVVGPRRIVLVTHDEEREQ